MKVNVIEVDLRAIIERVTTVTLEQEVAIEKGCGRKVYVFEHLGQSGLPYHQRIQDWECDDITHLFSSKEREVIYNEVHSYWASIPRPQP